MGASILQCPVLKLFLSAMLSSLWQTETSEAVSQNKSLLLSRFLPSYSQCLQSWNRPCSRMLENRTQKELVHKVPGMEYHSRVEARQRPEETQHAQERQ